MSLTMPELVDCFGKATVEEANYVGVLIKMPGFEKDEIIINSKENFAGKMAYYNKTYDENLEHKHAPGIAIVGFGYGNSPDEIVSNFEGYM
jgi:hypothetical protein